MHRGLFLGLGNVSPATSGVGELSPQGKLTVHRTSPSGPWPYWGNIWGVTQDIDNQSIISYGLSGSGPNQKVFVRWDPTVQAVTSVIWSMPASNTPPHPSSDTTLNPKGNVVGYWHGGQTNQIVEFNPRTGAMTASPMPVIPANWGWLGGVGGVEWDKINDGFYGANSNAWNNPMQQTLLWTSGDLRSSRVVATASSTATVAALGGTLLDNGDWVSSSMNGQFAYLEVKAGSGRWTTGGSLGGNVFVDVSAEKYAAPGRGYYASITNFGGQYYVGYVNAVTTPHTITTLLTTPQPNVVGGILEVHPQYQRDLCTRKTGNRTWDVLINPDPTGTLGLQGKTYVIAASLTGARPAITLNDGREIFLVPDILTLLTLQGPLPPFLTRNHGVLATNGASAKLDVSLLGPAASGVVVHFCGVVLGPKAPSGIAWVLDPWPVRL